MKICGKHLIAAGLFFSLIVFGSISCKTGIPVDVPAPSNVTELTVVEGIGEIHLSWKDVSDEDVYGYEVSYDGNSAINRAAFTPLDIKSMVVAPGSEGCTISNLEYGTEYTFTVKTVGIIGNKSEGVSVKGTSHINPEPELKEIQYYKEVKMTSYNFEYTSTDPYGKPARLSGAITIGDEVTKDSPATGLFLYNHFTVYQKDECPSHGDLMVQKLLVGSGFITISADYYGFGSTEDKNQAYCIANTNAQASVDALLAAKKLLVSMGYTWNDVLFNAGYSQGGQTTAAVVKLVTEKYPDIRFTWSFAGGGPYSIPLTYDTFLGTPETAMPSTVISVLLSYNEFYNLGFKHSELFKEPLLSNIDEWFFSKKYKNSELDQFLTTKVLTDYIVEDALNKESEIYKKFSAAMEKENLCAGWEPRKDENIVIEHNESDDVVTVENAKALLKFFEEKGLSVSKHDEDKDSGVIDYVQDFGDLTAFMNIGPHPYGALPFLVEIISHIQDLPGLKDFSPSESALYALLQ